MLILYWWCYNAYILILWVWFDDAIIRLLIWDQKGFPDTKLGFLWSVHKYDQFLVLMLLLVSHVHTSLEWIEKHSSGWDNSLLSSDEKHSCSRTPPWNTLPSITQTQKRNCTQLQKVHWTCMATKKGLWWLSIYLFNEFFIPSKE